MNLAQLLGPHLWSTDSAWFGCTASFRTDTSGNTSVEKGMSVNHNGWSLLLNLFHSYFILIQFCWSCLSLSWFSTFYLHDWRLSFFIVFFFGQKFQNKEVILILASSLLASHCYIQFCLEYIFPVMDSSKHNLSQGHNFEPNKVTILFMCYSDKSSHKESSFW